MDYDRIKPFLISFTCHFVICFATSAVYAVSSYPEFGPWQRLLVFPICHAVLYSQQLLLFIWASIGQGPWALRWATAFLGGCAIWGSLGMLLLLYEGSWILVLPAGVTWALWHSGPTFALMICATGPLLVARLRGYHLQRFDRDKIPRSTCLQISIRGMLLLTFVVASLLAVAHYLGNSGVILAGGTVAAEAPIGAPFSSLERMTLARQGMFVALWLELALAAVLGVWSCLSIGRVPGRLLVSALVLTGAVAFLPYLFQSDAISYFYWGFPPVGAYLIVATTLLVFRAHGYRFLRPEVSGDSRSSAGQAPRL